MSDSSGPRVRAGRRTNVSSRRPDRFTVVVVLLPLLTALLLVLVSGREATDRFGVRDTAAPPTSVPVDTSTLICPGGIERTFVASAGADGEFTVRRAGANADAAEETEPVTGGEVTRLPRTRMPRVIAGTGEVASDLIASRFTVPFAAAECGEPEPEAWFTGAGAGARYSSTLELVNPDAGPAIVDIAVYGRGGQVEAPQLRGLAVPARGSVRLRLDRVLPRRDELALRVVASRGRVRASVSGRLDRLDGGAPSVDWLGAQDAPRTTNRLIGVDDGPGQRTLVLANPADAEARATIRLITPESTFAPLDAEPVVVAPGSTLRIDAGPFLRDAAAQGAIGLEVQSSMPVTASLRSLVDDDLTFSAPGDPVTSATALVVPTGAKRLLLAGATGNGSVTVLTTDGAGGPEREREVQVVAGRGYSVPLPDAAALVRVTPNGLLVEASVVRSDAGSAGGSGGQGTVVMRLQDLIRESLVPDVRPGAPS